MHRAFHIERQHVVTNLCPCDGCAQADNLKLKFVAHIGEVALLKNPVQVPEYVLFSEELHRIGQATLPDPVHEVWQDLEGIGPFARTSWTSRTSRAHSLGWRIPPGSDASGGRSPLSAVHAGPAAPASYRFRSLIPPMH
jgi:hypothetical protein